jgi:hypothetical protein
MIDAQLTFRGPRGTRTVALADYLDPAAEEAAHEASYRWIKDLRTLPVDGAPFRERFTARNDSLWWFSELYLHKERVILDVHRVISATAALLERDRPSHIAVDSGSPVVRHVASELARLRSVEFDGAVRPIEWLKRLAMMDLRARRLTMSSRAARLREARRSDGSAKPAEVAAFVHRAFWRSGAVESQAESYIGPILSELESRLGRTAVNYVGVGASTNFRVRRRWTVSAPSDSPSVVPVERFATGAALDDSTAMWKGRYAAFRALTRAGAFRQVARIHGIDCWPLIREQLAGIAWLQWPWSVRVMDEAGAALDALRPRVVVTYAEAGGWGRALVLEARRRGIPSVGLQHGFIYRHWLNYRHEPDEMAGGNIPPFPHPTKTLVFDAYAARHLTQLGQFPADSLRVTGSPRLDVLASDMERGAAGATKLRDDLKLSADAVVLLVATKEKEARRSLPEFIDAAARIPRAVVVIKPHPAETDQAYSAFADRSHVRIVRTDTSLAALLALARAVITVNSTVALDAAALDIPALSIGLPNNLTPFVESGAIAGTEHPAELGALLERILYDEGFRQQLAARRREVFGESVTGRERHAATRTVDSILELIGIGRARAAETG